MYGNDSVLAVKDRAYVLRTIEQHLAMSRQERRQAGISTPRKIIEAARDELLPYVEAPVTEYRMSTTEALPRPSWELGAEDHGGVGPLD